MLLHRLPLEPSEQCSFSSTPHARDVDALKRVSITNWMTTILVLDVLAFAVANILTSRTAPQFSLSIIGCTAAWLAAAYYFKLYRRATMLVSASLVMPGLASATMALGGAVLVATGLNGFGTALTLQAAALAGCTIGWIIATRLMWELCLRAELRRGHCVDRALVLAGTADAAYAAAEAIERATRGAIRVAAKAALPGTPGAPPFFWLEEAVRHKLVDRILITDCSHTAGACAAILPWLAPLPIDIALVPSGRPIRQPFIRLADAWPMGLERPLPRHRGNRALGAASTAVKRIEDIGVALMALAVSAPILLAIAIAIRLDSPGPVLFRQNRAGRHNQVFRMWKFRTMYADMQDDACLQQTRRDDARITRVGRLLRKTSLDELPQLVNVLLGDMSIVGPRPHALGMAVAGHPVDQLVSGYHARLAVKPGMTGLAQVNGSRGAIETEEQLRRRLHWDREYIDNWSLGLDLHIMARTAILLAFDKHAY